MQEESLALIESAKTVGSQRLHDAHIDVGIVMAEEGVAVQIDVLAQSLEIVVKQLLTQRRRQVRLGVEQQGSDVILQSALASALVIEEEGIAISQHHIARLEVAIQEVFAVGAQQEALSGG